MDLHLSPLEPDVQARLLFLRSDELLFQWNDETNNLQSKLIAHQDARIAFAKMEDDTGWLSSGVVRAGRNSRGAWVVYVAPPQLMNISTDQNESLSIPIPMSLFVGWGHRYYLFALQGKTFAAEQPCVSRALPKRLRQRTHMLGESQGSCGNPTQYWADLEVLLCHHLQLTYCVRKNQDTSR